MKNRQYLVLIKKRTRTAYYSGLCDDLIFGATSEHLCEEFSTIMGKEIEMSMMGELPFFLGLQIKQSSNGISISLENYIKEQLKKFNMFDSKPIDTPM